LAEFSSMGGYVAYVWSAFAFTFLVMAGLLAQSWRGRAAGERELEALRRRCGPGAARRRGRRHGRDGPSWRDARRTRSRRRLRAEGGGIREGA
jgi:heme exporter protein CcmD